ncbi:LuxR C-terminal-related transcriptional regulator [Lactobacillus selangorensis]
MTVTERKVFFRIYCDGADTKTVAHELHLSRRTIQVYQKNIKALCEEALL